MSDHDIRTLVTIGIALLVYQVVLGPIVLAVIRDALRTRREKRLEEDWKGRHGKS